MFFQYLMGQAKIIRGISRGLLRWEQVYHLLHLFQVRHFAAGVPCRYRNIKTMPWSMSRVWWLRQCVLCG